MPLRPPPPRIKIFFDGGYRPEPAGMETAVVVRGKAHVRQQLGPGTSIDAEWLALIDALRIARDLGLGNVVLLGDCAPVVAQANGTARCSAGHRRYRDAALALAEQPLRVRLIGRSQNLAGIALARLHPR